MFGIFFLLEQSTKRPGITQNSGDPIGMELRQFMFEFTQEFHKLFNNAVK